MWISFYDKGKPTHPCCNLSCIILLDEVSLCLSVSQPSNGASCQSPAETDITMAAAVKPVTTTSITMSGFVFSADFRRHPLVLPLCHHVIICCHGAPLAQLLIISSSKCKFENQTLQFWWESDQFPSSRNKSVARDFSAVPGWNLLPLRSTSLRFCMPLMFHQWFRMTSFACSAPLSWMSHGAQRGAAHTVREWNMYNKWSGVNWRWWFSSQVLNMCTSL